jgi:hypothetical protein
LYFLMFFIRPEFDMETPIQIIIVEDEFLISMHLESEL